MECDNEGVKEMIERINANLEENRKLWAKIKKHSKMHGCEINL